MAKFQSPRYREQLTFVSQRDKLQAKTVEKGNTVETRAEREAEIVRASDRKGRTNV